MTSCKYFFCNPQYKVIKKRFEFFRKFAEIFASQCAPLASTTPVANLPPTPAYLFIYIYVNSTIQRCPNKIIKLFLIEDFFHLPPKSTTPVINLEQRISPRFSKKFEAALTVYSGAWGKLIHEKNQKSKISWHCPFNVRYLFSLNEFLP